MASVVVVVAVPALALGPVYALCHLGHLVHCFLFPVENGVLRLQPLACLFFHLPHSLLILGAIVVAGPDKGRIGPLGIDLERLPYRFLLPIDRVNLFFSVSELLLGLDEHHFLLANFGLQGFFVEIDSLHLVVRTLHFERRHFSVAQHVFSVRQSALGCFQAGGLVRLNQ